MIYDPRDAFERRFNRLTIELGSTLLAAKELVRDARHEYDSYGIGEGWRYRDLRWSVDRMNELKEEAKNA
tara:strand:- start:215 stop:424 length:210 start_codon:yes stop_codon:yes gene_type:complete